MLRCQLSFLISFTGTFFSSCFFLFSLIFHSNKNSSFRRFLPFLSFLSIFVDLFTLYISANLSKHIDFCLTVISTSISFFSYLFPTSFFLFHSFSFCFFRFFLFLSSSFFLNFVAFFYPRILDR